MKEYLRLQWLMLNRRVAEFGLPMAIVVLLVVAFVVGGSFFLFERTSFAPYLMMLAVLSPLMALGEERRNDFLKTILPKWQYLKIRLAENVIVATPFAVVLVGFGCLWQAIALLSIAAVLAFNPMKQRLNFVLSTPFYKYPFEFASGFRRTFYVVIGAYALCLISIWVGNFNLGVFSIALLYLLMLTYFGEPENEYYVWVYALNPRDFLFQKVWRSLMYSLILVFPPALMLGVWNCQGIMFLFMVIAAGSLLLTSVIFAKYSAYPHKMSLPQGLLFGLCVWFPPMAILAVPIFYSQAKKRLKPYLK